MKWVSILRTHILAVSLSYDYLEFVAANEHERTELKLQYPKEKRLFVPGTLYEERLPSSLVSTLLSLLQYNYNTKYLWPNNRKNFSIISYFNNGILFYSYMTELFYGNFG